MNCPTCGVLWTGIRGLGTTITIVGRCMACGDSWIVDALELYQTKDDTASETCPKEDALS